MTAASARLFEAPSRTLGRAAWTWYAVYVGYTAAAMFGPAWLTAILGWSTAAGIAALLLAIALRAAYRRGGRAADDWYEPRLAELRAELHALVRDEYAAYPGTISAWRALAASRRARLRELNDRVQSADFWGRSL